MKQRNNSDHSSDNSSADDDRLRVKYLDALEQLDSLEQQATGSIDQLRKTLLVTIVLCEGMAQPLDEQLQTLKQSLRGETLQLNISQHVESFQQQADRIIQQQPLAKSSEGLESIFRLLRDHPALASENKTIKQNIKLLQKQSLFLAEFPGYIQSLKTLVMQLNESETKQPGSKYLNTPLEEGREDNASLARELLEAEPEPSQISEHLDTEESFVSELEKAPSEKPSFWKKLFKPSSKTSLPSDTAPQSPTELTEQSNNILPVESAESSDKQEQMVFKRIESLLKEFINRLPSVDALSEDIDLLKTLLNQPLTWYELLPTLESLTAVAVAVINQNREDFQHFLQELNNRLSDFQQRLVQAQAGMNATLVDISALQNSVQNNVGSIRESISSAADLQSLKHTVENRLDNILSSMEQYHQQAKDRTQVADQLNVLVERIASMEQHTKELQADLVKERDRATRDPLTTLANRGAYEERVQLEFARWKRYQAPLVICIADIDFFKRINDQYGHLAGDKLLKIFAQLLTRRLREVDFVARYGGEEFVILMSNTPIEDAQQVIEEVRKLIETTPFHFQQQEVAVTASFGLTALKKGDDPHSAFARADEALYKAKQSGRNQCCIG
ncbi:GGDEF domain-containing protein [Zooshikella harenae]|uniref:diguanylate cyclase n=1 Tax=Zooshikella harenae TaxID=2827238 RepID=A0ABS5Z9T3_9GAMM|nr:GGDEF domain-containing protein [Zooshikella harenae]MBU2710811.1 GGDEF domain-containing protein [Zooshikella harenae]